MRRILVFLLSVSMFNGFVFSADNYKINSRQNIKLFTALQKVVDKYQEGETAINGGYEFLNVRETGTKTDDDGNPCMRLKMDVHFTVNKLLEGSIFDMVVRFSGESDEKDAAVESGRLKFTSGKSVDKVEYTPDEEKW